MKYSINKLAKLSMLKISKEEEKMIAKKVQALGELLEKLDAIEPPKEAFVLAPEGEHKRDDVPVQFDSEEIIKVFNEVKGRYLKGPKTL
jgi:aspartyl/glutamyl-tRNA(Asn/Gln) amidotransferase C subunit